VRTLICGLLTALLLVIGVGCGDSDSSPTPTSTLVDETEIATGTPSSYGAYPPGTSTGVDEVDAVARVIERGSPGEVEDLFRYEEVRCQSGVSGIGGPPSCQTKDGEADGTIVRVFELNVCEREWRREGSVEDIVEMIAGGQLSVLAVATSGERSELYMSGMNDAHWVRLSIEDAAISAVKLPCGGDDVRFFLDQEQTFTLPPNLR